MTIDVSLMQCERLLEVEGFLDINDYDTVFLNLTSILNTMFYDNILQELKEPDKMKTYTDGLQTIFKNSIMKIHRTHVKYYFYYSSKPSRNKKYYDAWDNYINKYKFSQPLHGIYEVFIQAVRRLAKGFNNIEIIDTGDIESAVFPYYYSLHHTLNKSLIISRDMMDFLNIPKGIHLFDSTMLFKNTERHTSKKISCVPPQFMKYYMYLLPIEKHSYVPPLPRAGKKNSVRYILTIVNSGVENAEMFHTKQFTIFDYDKYIRDEKIHFNIK